MQDILIGLAIGVGGLLVPTILSFILLRMSMTGRDDDRERYSVELGELRNENKQVVAERDHALESDRIRHDNEQKLLAENASLKIERSQQAARIAAAEASVDDLSRVLEDHPSAVPDAFRAAAIRLRQQLSASGQAAPSTASRDPGGEGDRAVHGGSDALERP